MEFPLDDELFGTLQERERERAHDHSCWVWEAVGYCIVCVVGNIVGLYLASK